jgi:uracil-DNA glycosylase family 4
MDPPCPGECDGGHPAVFGYGDANADFHVVGDHPGVHGGTETGVPFTGTDAGERLLDVLAAVGLLAGREDGALDLPNCFLSYLYGCCQPNPPTDDEYATYEPFFDSELRAISAHVLVPVGARATRHVLKEYTARNPTQDLREIHATELRGSGFLVVPLSDPAEWTDDDHAAAVETLVEVQSTDYAQTADLGRFIPGGDPYFVR